MFSLKITGTLRTESDAIPHSLSASAFVLSEKLGNYMPQILRIKSSICRHRVWLHLTAYAKYSAVTGSVSVVRKHQSQK